MPGLDTCRSHGAGTAAARAAGQRRIAEREAQRTLTRVLHRDDAAPVANYAEELGKIAGSLRDAVSAAGSLVNNLNGALTVTNAEGTVQTHPTVQLWERLIAQFRDVVAIGQRLGLSEYSADLSAEQGAQIAAIFHRAERELTARLGADQADVHAALAEALTHVIRPDAVVTVAAIEAAPA